MHDKDKDIRIAAAIALGSFSSGRDKADYLPKAREVAVRALWKLSGKDPDEDVLRAASKSLEHFHPAECQKI